MKRDKIYVVMSDVHIPYQSVAGCRAVCDLMKDLQPDGIVLNGDILDLIELSRHSSASVAKLEGRRINASFKAANKQLDEWQAAAGPQCTDNHFIDGNHEDRLARWLATGDNAVWIGDEATDIGLRLGLAARGFQYHKGYPEAHIRLGHLVVTHGRWTSKYAAATHLDRYRKSVLVGHCHTPGVHYGPGLDNQQVGIVTGHLADINSEAMKYAPVPNSWRQGFAVVALEPNGLFHVQPVNFVEGCFYFGGKKYGMGRRRNKT
jgi:predicted phosphodiesterase